jgi:hypothetical protein
VAFLSSQKWYCGSTKYTAVAQWAASTAYAAGNLVRQLATPTVGSERVFVCIIAGTSGGSEPTWTVTQGAKNTDNTVTWQEVTVKAGVNGDLTNTSNWNTVKNTAVSLGVIIQRISGGSLQICTTAGTAGNGAEPSFSDTAGVTTADNTVTWTSLGAPSSYAAYAAPWANLAPAKVSTVFISNGDTVYISNNHAWSQSTSISYTAISGTAALPINYICVSDAAAPPTSTATTASFSTTGSTSISWTGGNEYVYGINFNAGSGASGGSINILEGSSGTNGNALVFDTCTFLLNSTNTGSTMALGAPSGTDNTSPLYVNCTYNFGSTSQSISQGFQAGYVIRGGAVATSGSVPTTLFKMSTTSGRQSYIYIDGLDASAITGTLFNTANFGGGLLQVTNSKFGSGITYAAGGFPASQGQLVVHNSDSTATNYNYYVQSYAGTVQQSTTIYNNAGASDGTTNISWKYVSTASATFTQPFTNDAIVQWNNLTGSSKTATVELTCATTLNNNDIWLELEYPGSASSPLSSFVSTKMALFGTPTALTTSTATWTGALANKYKLQVTFTPQLKGVIKARIYVAKSSTTVYVDPLVTVA